MARLDDLRKVIGPDAAIALIQHFGGDKLYVPITAHEAHRITKAIGAQPAAALSRHLGGEYIDIPSPREIRRERILAMAAAHTKPSEIARRLGCSKRWVNRVLSEPA